MSACELHVHFRSEGIVPSAYGLLSTISTHLGHMVVGHHVLPDPALGWGSNQSLPHRILEDMVISMLYMIDDSSLRSCWRRKLFEWCVSPLWIHASGMTRTCTQRLLACLDSFRFATHYLLICDNPHPFAHAKCFGLDGTVVRGKILLSHTLWLLERLHLQVIP